MTTEQPCADELLANAVTPAASRLTERLANVTTYTTTALMALADFHFDNGDEEGSELLLEFAKRFAAYEVTTL